MSAHDSDTMPWPETLIIDQARVVTLLTMRQCMDVMSETLTALAAGRTMQPLRTVMMLPQSRNAFAVMPALVRNTSNRSSALGVKVITVFPGNDETRLDSHQGAVLLFDEDDGRLLAIIDASAITAIRTAAVSGVATRLLARADAGDLAILGSGVQAATHLEAMLEARPIRRIRVWSRTLERTRAFAERAARRHGIVIEACAAARDAVDGADIICTTTAARSPVLLGEWIAAGAHINAVGASLPSARELATAAVAMARLFVDRRESALAEAGDFLIPRAEGAIDDSHILAELGDVLTGAARGRESAREVTLFKSLGLAVEDLAAARFLHDRALAEGGAERIALGGLRDHRR